ncbi:winged helix-turn-helix domain-containing protein [Streptomyces synnematoformans]|uniref:ArsR/SmtB family transcription factor n=1 Tax=Streptomyces synnematoformans TaxID=415721 RepID=UPI0031CF199E
MATTPDPLWETAVSLHRFQTRRGRWAYAGWHRSTRMRLRERGIERAVRDVLIPLFPRAAYFPDFLTPAESAEGLDAGLEAIVATPSRRVMREIAALDAVVGAPAWAARLVDWRARVELTGLLRAYVDAAITPYGDTVAARIEAQRGVHLRQLRDAGARGMLEGLGPVLRWEEPVLHAAGYPVDRDVHLDGRGLVLVPSYFCWGDPITLADPALPPTLIYPLLHEPSADTVGDVAASLAALLGHTRAQVLRAAATGATTGELARAVGVSTASASRHAGVLREAGLLCSSRCAAMVLHTLTPLGRALLQRSPVLH